MDINQCGDLGDRHDRYGTRLVLVLNESPEEFLEIAPDPTGNVDLALTLVSVEAVAGLKPDGDPAVQGLSADQRQVECPLDLINREGGGELVADQHGGTSMRNGTHLFTLPAGVGITHRVTSIRGVLSP